jgi:hypothetical protein
MHGLRHVAESPGLTAGSHLNIRLDLKNIIPMLDGKSNPMSKEIAWKK